MKIVAGRDYYDSASRFGVDSTITFVRNNRNPMKTKDVPVEIQLPGLRIYSKKSPRNLDIWSPVFVVIADKIWRGIRIHEEKKERSSVISGLYTTSYETHYYWSLKTLNAGVDRLNLLIESKIHSWSNKVPVNEEYFTEKSISKELMDWMIENNATIITGFIDNGEYEINVNKDDLKNFEFYKVVDAFQAHQRIEQWVSGVLPRSANPMIQISDKDKAHKHGFWKWSFKTPGKKGL